MNNIDGLPADGKFKYLCMETHTDCGEMIKELNRTWELDLAEDLRAAELEILLAEKLNSLIQSDFNALVRLLYRIDINEARLRDLLKENAQEDAGKIIARLIIERQWQKILSRRQYRAQEDAGKRNAWPAGSGKPEGSQGAPEAGSEDPGEEAW
jgi:hypothetical protein